MPTPLDRAAAFGLAPILGRALARIRLKHTVRAVGAGLVGAAVAILLADLVRISASRTAVFIARALRCCATP